jgi:hypothetical protein
MVVGDKQELKMETEKSDETTNDAVDLPEAVQGALQANAKIGGSRMISYGGMQILAPARDIQQAIEALQNGDRQRIMVSVRKSIKRVFPQVKRGTASQEKAMICGQDIAIWFANEIIEGRQTLVMN